MAFDPSLPQANAPIVSAELRAQFNGLKELVDGLPSSPGMLAALQANTAGNVDSVSLFSDPGSDPPTQEDFWNLQRKVNELITALQRRQ